jgi:putative transposase
LIITHGSEIVSKKFTQLNNANNKSISAREFFKKYPEIKKKYFWGGKLWTASYFVETIGNATEDVIRAYVRDQLKEMDKLEKRSIQLTLL